MVCPKCQMFACTCPVGKVMLVAALHVYEFAVDWVIAESERDAMAVYRKHHVLTVCDLTDAECSEDLADGCVEIEDDQALSILIDEHGNVTDSGIATRKMCGEWAKERGRGFLCTSEF